MRITPLLAVSLTLAAGTAEAIPFQISGSSLDADFLGLGGGFTYTANSMSGATDLATGEYFDFNFGTVDIPFSLGIGTATLTVNFAAPDPDGSVQDSAEFSVLSLWIFSLGSLDWGNPVTFDYSYGGQSGGLFKLDMFDIGGIQAGTSVDLWGRITNLRSPGTTSSVPVPEPGTLILLGSGLLGLGLFRRRAKTLA